MHQSTYFETLGSIFLLRSISHQTVQVIFTKAENKTDVRIK